MLNFIEVNRPPYQWIINKEYVRIFIDHFVGSESFLYGAASRNVLKDNNARTIFFVQLPKKADESPRLKDAPPVSALVKRYKIRGLAEILKATFSSLAYRELRFADYLLENHIETIQPLAILKKKRYGLTTELFIFIKKIENAVPLKDVLASDVSNEDKNALLQSLAGLIKQVQQTRFFHKDLHLGNILVELKNGETEERKNGPPGSFGFKLYIIDLHRSALPANFTKAHQVANVAQMAYSVSTVRPVTDAYRFVRYYYEPGFTKEGAADFIRQVFRKARSFRHRHWSGRNNRCLRNSSAYQVILYNPAKAHYRIYCRRHPALLAADDIPGQLIDLVNRHNSAKGGSVPPQRDTEGSRQIVSQEPNRLFKHTAKHSISKIPLPGPDQQSGQNVFIKEYRYGLGRRLASILGSHPARDNWFAANGLMIRGVPTAEPIGLVERVDHTFGWVKRAYVITAEVKAVPTNQFITNKFTHLTGPDALSIKKQFIKEFALFVQRLHRRGIFHCDFKANNILISENETGTSASAQSRSVHSDGKLSFHLIDLDRVKFLKEIPYPSRILNLAQLNAAVLGLMTRADRLRFYRFYAHLEPDLSTAREKAIIRHLMKITIARKHFWPSKFS